MHYFKNNHLYSQIPFFKIYSMLANFCYRLFINQYNKSFVNKFAMKNLKKSQVYDTLISKKIKQFLI